MAIDEASTDATCIMGEAQAQEEIWKYIFGFVEIAVVKCAIELGIADAIENSQGIPMTVSELSSTLECNPTHLYRIMRFLAHRRIFKEKPKDKDSSIIGYVPTPLSNLLMKNGAKSMASLVLLESSQIMMAPWHCLSKYVKSNASSPFEMAHGENVWTYCMANPAHKNLINEAMACHARVCVSTIIKGCPEVFEGLGTLVDVGGGNGTALSVLVKACPRIKGINFDLPQVVSEGLEYNGIEHVGGDMFERVPKADAAFIMWVLHDWSDNECIHILKNCKNAIPKDKGKVIIVEAVIEEEEHKDKLKDVGLLLDMVMMAHTSKGKERTAKEWAYVIGEAGFTRHTVKPMSEVCSVIEAYP